MDQYANMAYRRCGRSGLLLPEISLGLWHNFGGGDNFETARSMIWRAFDLGVTHFDLANNYGPPPGSAEETFGRILKEGFQSHRDEVIVSTKAGHLMWAGPYGEWGSRKYLMASLDQSLKRMGLDYVDIFYSHRPDPHTPLEETITTLGDMVRQGKALYVGISGYDPQQTLRAVQILREERIHLLMHQPSYSMFNRTVETSGLLKTLSEEGVGCICFSPLAQGLLTDKYLHGIPAGSRASKGGFLKPEQVTEEKLEKVRRLSQVAMRRGQSMAQLAISWVLRRPEVTSALIGASKVSQIEELEECVRARAFEREELDEIDRILQASDFSG